MMSKHFGMVALVALMLIASTAWAQSALPFTDSAAGYTIMYPAGWERQTMGSTTVALSPQETPTDSFRENVNVTHETLAMPMAPQQYAAASIQAMQRQLVNFTVVEQGAEVLNGNQAHFVVYRHHMMGRDLTVLAYFITRGNRGYVLTCTAAPNAFARYRPIFVQIGNTIRFQ